MKISTLLYSLKQGLKNIQRNLLFSLASVGTIVACLFLFGIFYIIVNNFGSMMRDVENTVAVSVFFNEGLSEEQIKSIGEQIRVRPEVNTMDYISAEDAWEKFALQLYGSAEEAKEAYGEDNPLADSASYNITLKNVESQKELVGFLESIPGVRLVKSSDVTAESLASLNVLVGYASVGIIIILLLVSIFLISNTITIGITVRKEEISIMKLIGATDFFVRAPFIVEGVVIGLVGSAVPSVILYFMYGMVTEYLLARFPILNGIISFVDSPVIFQRLIPISLILGIGIGFFGSIITTRKHLRV